MAKLQFNIPLTTPEIYHDENYCWLKIDEYSTTEIAVRRARHSFAAIVNRRNQQVFCQDTTKFEDPEYPACCIGCAYKNALRTSAWSIPDYAKLKVVEHALASASYIYDYDSKLQFLRPQHDLVQYLKQWAPIAYEDHGKKEAAYEGLRVSPNLAVSYATWGKQPMLHRLPRCVKFCQRWLHEKTIFC